MINYIKHAFVIGSLSFLNDVFKIEDLLGERLITINCCYLICIVIFVTWNRNVHFFLLVKGASVEVTRESKV